VCSSDLGRGHAGFLSALSGEEDNGLGHGRF
jgi:hypothetical protein